MAYVAFSVSRQGAISENGGVLPQREWALCRYDTSHRYVDGTKGWFLLETRLVRHGARSRAFVSSSVLDANG